MGTSPRNSRNQAAEQESLKAKAAQAEASDADEEDDGDLDEEGSFGIWMRESPSWLISMVVHMILLIVLGLIGLAVEKQDEIRELVIGDPDVTEEEMEEDTNETLNEEMEEEESETEEEVEEVTAPVDTQIEAPEFTINTQQDDVSLAAAQIDFSDFATESAFSGDSASDVGGAAASGLGSRSTGGRAGAVRRGGGNKGSESAVEAALRWLANHQNRDGSWSFNHTAGDKCSGFANPGEVPAQGPSPKMGATGLALLPFLAAGYTHQPSKNNKYEYVVKKGLAYLVGNMDRNSGRLYEPNGYWHYHMYSHGIAACALAEAYGMTQDQKLKLPAQKALNYIVAAQDPQSGGWLYEPRTGGDTSVVCWQIMALKSGILSYLTVPGHVKTMANKWLDSVGFDPSQYGGFAQYGYREPHARDHVVDGDAAMTALGLLCRNYLGTKKDDPGQRKGVEFLGARGPGRDNVYYNYHATMVMYQNDGPKGPLWKKWNKVMRDMLINSQVKQGDDAGSWYYGGNHGESGGRLMSTCLCAMTLEVYYRYLPVYQQDNVEQDDFPDE
ncbi:MAG: prenyltransferase/squalene oxidase repeat-containing protein [Planctomycetota bacterium]|nr:prenyltransferase/squalene oxidase repeat-containing protein [Planctomycetota bacterium]